MAGRGPGGVKRHYSRAATGAAGQRQNFDVKATGSATVLLSGIRVTWQVAEADRPKETAHAMNEFETCPFDAPLGAEIRGLDIGKPLDPNIVEAVRAAWHAHLVLLFRDQDLTDQQHFDFTEQFGPLDHPPKRLLAIAAGENVDDDELLAINVISNVVENGEPIGVLGHGEANWHSDSTFVERPPAASLLRSLEMPDAGGDTQFMNMYKALETLPGDLRQAIEGRSSKHDPAYSSSGERRAEFTELDPTRSPGPVHPLTRTHLGTGRKALFLGRRLGSYIVGLPLD